MRKVGQQELSAALKAGVLANAMIFFALTAGPGIGDPLVIKAIIVLLWEVSLLRLLSRRRTGVERMWMREAHWIAAGGGAWEKRGGRPQGPPSSGTTVRNDR